MSETTTPAAPAPASRCYAVRCPDAWGSNVQVIERTLEAALTTMQSEIEALEPDEAITLTVKCVLMTEATLAALPEWDGP